MESGVTTQLRTAVNFKNFFEVKGKKKNKTHDLLVLLGSIYYYTYTGSLSTWSSARDLQSGKPEGRPYLKGSFPLRCFQRLSLPIVATLLCGWRHNRYTRGSSIPVLSY